MACKHYKSTIFSDYCTAKQKEEKVTFDHAKEYCRSCYTHWYERCQVYKEAEKRKSGRFW